MAKIQEKSTFMSNNPTPIIMEHDEGGRDMDDVDYSNEVSGGGCGCFRLFCFENRHSNEGETTGFLHKTGDFINKETWVMRRVKSLKELSEVVAGPKWKNFIRKFSKKPRKTTTQYDPKSYALNFNDGVIGGGDGEDDDLLPRSFSTRFAPPVPGDQRRVIL